MAEGIQAHNLKVLGSNPSPATNLQALKLTFQGLFIAESSACAKPFPLQHQVAQPQRAFTDADDVGAQG